MTITAIERMKSRQARYRIRFDDRDAMTLSEDLLVRFALAPGDELPEATFAALLEADEATSARQAAYHYLSYRARSDAEVRRYLTKKGFSKERAASTAGDMMRLGLIDDEAFAAMVIRDALARGNSGPMALRAKLSAKGIGKEIIDRLIRTTFTEDLQREKASELLRKRIRRTERSLKKLLPLQRKARLYQYLAQRGFSNDAARHALKTTEV